MLFKLLLLIIISHVHIAHACNYTCVVPLNFNSSINIIIGNSCSKYLLFRSPISHEEIKCNVSFHGVKPWTLGEFYSLPHYPQDSDSLCEPRYDYKFPQLTSPDLQAFEFLYESHYNYKFPQLTPPETRIHTYNLKEHVQCVIFISVICLILVVIRKVYRKRALSVWLPFTWIDVIID
jgi:hypothetical protein